MAERDTDLMADALKLIGGGLVGAGIALLLAPQAGKQTRKDIVRYARTIRGKTPAAVHEFSTGIADFMKEIGDKAAEILESGTELSDEAKQSLLSALEKGQERLEKQKRRIAQMLA